MLISGLRVLFAMLSEAMQSQETDEQRLKMAKTNDLAGGGLTKNPLGPVAPSLLSLYKSLWLCVHG